LEKLGSIDTGNANTAKNEQICLYSKWRSAEIEFRMRPANNSLRKRDDLVKNVFSVG